MAFKTKKVLNRMVACSRCKKLHMVYDVTIGYQCSYCNKYNNSDEAEERYRNGEFIEPENNHSSIGIPAVRSMDSGKTEYFNLRDEYEIRADMFSKGMTRNSMGVDKFNNTLRKELIKNKCYRGPDKTGV